MSEPRACPSCKSPMASDAVLCVRCGYDLRTRKKLTISASRADRPPAKAGTSLIQPAQPGREQMLPSFGGLSRTQDLAEYEDLKRDRRLFLILQFVFGVPGLIMQMAGLSHPLGWLGTVLLIIGLVFVAKYKGQSGYWGLCGLLSFIGLIILLVLPDHYRKPLRDLENRIGRGEVKKAIPPLERLLIPGLVSLAIVAAVAVPAALLVRPIIEQNEALKKLQSRGAEVEYFADTLPRQYVVRFTGGRDVDEQDLSLLRKAYSVGQLRVDGAKHIDEEGLVHLHDHPNLYSISFYDCPAIADKGLEHLSRCGRLSFLTFENCPSITDEGVKHLAALEEMLGMTFKECPGVTPLGLEHLKGMRRLDKLEVEDCGKPPVMVPALAEEAEPKKPARVPPPLPEPDPAPPPLAERPLRIWRDSSGLHTVEAVLETVDGGKAVLKRPDGTSVEIPLDRLSNEDRQWIGSHASDATGGHDETFLATFVPLLARSSRAEGIRVGIWFGGPINEHHLEQLANLREPFCITGASFGPLGPRESEAWAAQTQSLFEEARRKAASACLVYDDGLRMLDDSRHDLVLFLGFLHSGEPGIRIGSGKSLDAVETLNRALCWAMSAGKDVCVATSNGDGLKWAPPGKSDATGGQDDPLELARKFQRITYLGVLDADGLADLLEAVQTRRQSAWDFAAVRLTYQ